jgi:hypothetical protein
VKIWNTYTQGLKTVNHNKRMLFVLFGIQFIFALIILLPLQAELSKMLEYSLMGQEALDGRGANVFVEFLGHHSETISSGKSLLLGMGLLYLFTTIFLNGGILGIFTKKDEKFSAKVFFENAGHYFGRFFRLFLFSLVFLTLAIIIFIILQSLAKAIAGDSESLKVTLYIILYVKLLVLIFLVNMTFDYAKIKTVIEERKGMFRTGLLAWRFVFKNFGKTMGLYYLIILQGILALLLYTFGFRIIGGITGGSIILLFLWQQFYVMFRTWIRLQFYASQTLLYENVADVK